MGNVQKYLCASLYAAVVVGLNELVGLVAALTCLSFMLVSSTWGDE